MQARILVADDDPGMLTALVAALERYGEILCADNGAGMIERVAHDGPFDLVVTDVDMPWMRGSQIVRAMRSSGVDTPVIVTTALRDDETLRQVQSLGGRVVLLQKPFGLSELDAAVEQLLPPHSEP